MVQLVVLVHAQIAYNLLYINFLHKYKKNFENMQKSVTIYTKALDFETFYLFLEDV